MWWGIVCLVWKQDIIGCGDSRGWGSEGQVVSRSWWFHVLEGCRIKQQLIIAVSKSAVLCKPFGYAHDLLPSLDSDGVGMLFERFHKLP